MPDDDDMRDVVASDDDDDDERYDDDDDASDTDASSSQSQSQSQSLDVDDDLVDAIMSLERTWDASTQRDYVTGARLIDALHRAKLRERCKSVREAYAARFALNELQWRAWIRDALEDKTTEKAERHARADALFARAIADVGTASVELWMGRLRLGLERGLDDDERRNAYEAAARGPGTHYVDGHTIWAAYRAFESSRANDASDVNARVKALFVRQLALPHGEIDGTMDAARAWAASADVGAAVVGELERAYVTGCAAKDLRAPYEEQIVLHDGQVPSGATLRAYKRYIEFEVASGAPARAEHVYERALILFPYVGELWREYLVFARKASDDMRATLLARALKTCPASVALWTYALDRHRSRALEDEALEARFRDVKDAASVLSVVIDRYFWHGENLDIHRVLDLTKRGFEHMKMVFSANASARDAVDVIRRAFLAPRMARRLAQSPGDVWAPVRDFLADIADDAPFKTAAEFVIARAEFEAMNDSSPTTTSSVLTILDSATQRGVEPVGVSKKSVDDATRVRLGERMILDAKLHYLASVDAKAYAKVYEDKTNFARASREVDFDAACERLDASAAAKAKLRAAASASTRKRTTGGDTTKPARKRSRRDDDAGAQHDAKLKDMDHDARVKALFPNRDQRTVFVKNLSWDVTDAELAEFFDGKGGDVNARIVKDKATGRPRGFAYVDFSEDAAVTAAIMRSGEKLKGRAIDVAKSRPPSATTDDGSGGRGRGRGRGRGPASDITGRGGRGGRGGLGLTPRAVAAAPVPADAAGKTNADFRAMFFVKSKEGET